MRECHTSDMARHKQDAPSHFGDLVALTIRRGMTELGMSGRSLARRLGKSEGYVRDRINGTFEFSLTDVENFALFIGVNPEDFIGSIDRALLEQHLGSVDRESPVALSDRITGGRTPGNVTPLIRHVAPSDGDLREVANETIDEHPAADDMEPPRP